MILPVALKKLLISIQSKSRELDARLKEVEKAVGITKTPEEPIEITEELLEGEITVEEIKGKKKKKK